MVNDDLLTSKRISGRKKPVWGRRVISSLRTILRSYPRVEGLVLKIWHPIKFTYWRLKWGFEASFGNQRGARKRSIDIDKIYLVNPEKITFTSQPEFRLRDYKGQILSGDWDSLEIRFDSLDLYSAIRQVCIEGKNWDETTFFQHTLSDIEQGRIHYSCRNEKEFLEHCQLIQALYSSIKENGYKSQQALYLSGQIDDPLVADEEVAVNIGRDGDLLFSDGAHRLAIAKILGVPRIPVKVAVRHSEWLNFRDEIMQFARAQKTFGETTLYQPITHLDLGTLPYSHEYEQRFQLISKNISIKKGYLLDLGANLGYFCHRFEEIGYDCVAIENNPQAVYFLKRLARAENRRFKIIHASILDSEEIRNTHYDVVLALNIFHHLLKSPETYEALVELLGHMQMDELFFETPRQDKPQTEGAYKDYSPDDFVEFILDNSVLDGAELIGKVQDGRPLYKLFRRK